MNTASIIKSKSLVEHFHSSVNSAVKNQGIDASEETIHYLVNILTAFSRSEYLFQQTQEGLDQTPLAFMYLEALSENSLANRIRILRKLGDTALFLVGVFSESFDRKVVAADYYIAMGGNAYSGVSEVMGNRFNNKSGQHLFDELTQKFVDFVDVLNEVSEHESMNNNLDIMRLHEYWLKTGSKRASAFARRIGSAYCGIT